MNTISINICALDDDTFATLDHCVSALPFFVRTWDKKSGVVCSLTCEGDKCEAQNRLWRRQKAVRWMQTHSQEEVKQLADIDLSQVKWRSRKRDTHCLSVECLCVSLRTSPTPTVPMHACTHTHTHTHTHTLGWAALAMIAPDLSPNSFQLSIHDPGLTTILLLDSKKSAGKISKREYK